MAADKKREMGHLSRCVLSSGKVIWMCPRHIAQDGSVTVLESDALDINEINLQEDALLAENLKKSASRLKPKPASEKSAVPSSNANLKVITTEKQPEKGPTIVETEDTCCSRETFTPQSDISSVDTERSPTPPQREYSPPKPAPRKKKDAKTLLSCKSSVFGV